jgi:hypothetical protein
MHLEAVLHYMILLHYVIDDCMLSAGYTVGPQIIAAFNVIDLFLLPSTCWFIVSVCGKRAVKKKWY